MKIVKLFKLEGWQWRGANKRETEDTPVFNELSHLREQMIFARWLGYKQEILITGDRCQRSEEFRRWAAQAGVAHLTFQKECFKRTSMPGSSQGGPIAKLKQTEKRLFQTHQQQQPALLICSCINVGVTCLSCWFVYCLFMAAFILFTAPRHQDKPNISIFMEMCGFFNLYEHRCLIL